MPFIKRKVKPRELSKKPVDKSLTDELEAVSNNTFCSILMQLSDLSQHAASIFEEITTEAKSLQQRSSRLFSRVTNLEEIVKCLDAKAVKVPVSNLDSFSLRTEHFITHIVYEKELFREETRPEYVQKYYESAKKSVCLDLGQFDKYRIDGIRSSQLYSKFPTFEELSEDTTDGRGGVVLLRRHSIATTPKAGRPHSDGDLLEEQLRRRAKSPLPTPEEVMRRNIMPSSIIPIDTTGKPFERMASFRRSLQLSDVKYLRRGKNRRSHRKRRRTVSGLSDMMKLNFSWDHLGLDSSTSSFGTPSETAFTRGAFYGSIDRRRVHSAYAAPVSLPDVSSLSQTQKRPDSLPSLNSAPDSAVPFRQHKIRHPTAGNRSPLHYADAPITRTDPDDAWKNKVVSTSSSLSSTPVNTPASSQTSLDKSWVASSAARPRSQEVTSQQIEKVLTMQRDQSSQKTKEEETADAIREAFVAGVKLRTTKPSMSKEERRSSSGNWSGTDSTRNSLTSDQIQAELTMSSCSPSDSAVSLDSESQQSPDKSSLERSDSDSTLNNDTPDTTPTTSSLNTPTHEVDVKKSITKMNTAMWLESVSSQEGLLETDLDKELESAGNDDVSLSSVTISVTDTITGSVAESTTETLTGSTTDTLTCSVADTQADNAPNTPTGSVSDVSGSVTTDGASSDASSVDLEFYLGSQPTYQQESDSSAYSVDNDGYFTSMRLDCGIKDYKAHTKTHKSTSDSKEDGRVKKSTLRPPAPPKRKYSFLRRKEADSSSLSSLEPSSSVEPASSVEPSPLPSPSLSPSPIPNGHEAHIVTSAVERGLNSSFSSESDAEVSKKTPMNSGLYTLCYQGSSIESSISEKTLSPSGSTSEDNERQQNDSSIVDDGEKTPTAETPPVSMIIDTNEDKNESETMAETIEDDAESKIQIQTTVIEEQIQIQSTEDMTQIHSSVTEMIPYIDSSSTDDDDDIQIQTLGDKTQNQNDTAENKMQVKVDENNAAQVKTHIQSNTTHYVTENQTQIQNNSTEDKIQNVTQTAKSNINSDSPNMKSYSRDKLKSARAAFFGVSEPPAEDPAKDNRWSVSVNATSISNMKTTRPNHLTGTATNDVLKSSNVATSNRSEPPKTTQSTPVVSVSPWVRQEPPSTSSDLNSHTYAANNTNLHHPSSTQNTQSVERNEDSSDQENKGNDVGVFPESYKTAKLSFFSSLRKRSKDEEHVQRPRSLQFSTGTWPHRRASNKPNMKSTSAEVYGSLRRSQTPDQPKDISRVLSPPLSSTSLTSAFALSTPNSNNNQRPYQPPSARRNSSDSDDQSVYFMPRKPYTNRLNRDIPPRGEDPVPYHLSYSSFTDDTARGTSTTSTNQSSEEPLRLVKVVSAQTNTPQSTGNLTVDTPQGARIAQSQATQTPKPIVSILKDPSTSRFKSDPPKKKLQSILKKPGSGRRSSAQDLFAKIHASKRRMNIKGDSSSFPRNRRSSSDKFGSDESLNSSCSNSTTRSITFSDTAYIENTPVKVNRISGKPQSTMEDFKALLREHSRHSSATESAMSALYVNTNVPRPTSADLSPSDTSTHSSASDLSDSSQGSGSPKLDKMVTVKELRSVMLAAKVKTPNKSGAMPATGVRQTNGAVKISEQPQMSPRHQLLEAIQEPSSRNNGAQRTTVTQQHHVVEQSDIVRRANLSSYLAAMKGSVTRVSLSGDHGSDPE
ncbi:serine-rich adhesin for platelets-like isoform X2 [Ptychodera flava]|uniref:serine-rich adhesin for platelets-like isoform X2 n=1 Tax=Ptychodera flava TaxID=63121 RepID=UPI00396A8EB1